MKLYTKRGDDGGTDLFGGQRIAKDSLRVEAYGTVDELNSVVGLAACQCRHNEISAILSALQNRLFDLGSDLACPRPPSEDDDLMPIARINADHVRQAEQWIDQTCLPLPPMRFFILPGGSEIAARLHLARTVCRRAERLCVALARHDPLGPDLCIYLNRLSDLFFALARRANQLEGVQDVPWTPRGDAQPS